MPSITPAVTTRRRRLDRITWGWSTKAASTSSEAISLVFFPVNLLGFILRQTPQLNERRLLFVDRYRDLCSANRTLEPSPFAPALKMSFYHRTAFGALGIGITGIIRFGFGNKSAFWQRCLP
jgi:hypothetical protein